jgi:hypothetical protein
MFRIDVYSHGFIVRWDNIKEQDLVYRYIDLNLTNYNFRWDGDTNTQLKEKVGQYAYFRPDLKQAALLKSELEKFKEYLEYSGVGINRYETKDYSKYISRGQKVNGVMNPMYKPRNEEQKNAVEFLSEDSDIRVVHAATGFGKTFCGYWTAVKTGVRTLFSMEPTHISTWIKDAKSYSDVTDEDIRIVSGSKDLIQLIVDGMNGDLTEKFIFLSSATWRNWLNADAEEMERYPITPVELMPTIGVGLVIRDEAHESLEALVNQTVFTHTAKVIYLSATLVNDSKYINGIYAKIFPKNKMWESQPNTHIDITTIFYRTCMQLMQKLRIRTPMGYSHVLYETSILKRKKAAAEYLGMFAEVIEGSFVKNNLKGTKCLVLCATVKMCEQAAIVAKEKFPQFTIGVFVGGKSTDELYERDIVFSTPKGAGTGKDIPNLAVIWNTVAIGSTTLQRQILGRGRPIKLYPDVSPRYYMLFNRAIPQHLDYERKRETDSVGRCKSYRSVSTNIVIRG